MSYLARLRAAGIASIAGAFAWVIGDMLIVGEHASPAQYPLLLIQYARRIDVNMAAYMVPSSPTRLASGALVAALVVPLYFLGLWHLRQGTKQSPSLWARAAEVLLFCGFAYSPLGHAGFYFVGMVYKAIVDAPPAAHETLLALAAQFHSVLLIAYIAAVGCIGLGLLALGIAILLGKTAYPRWMAAIANPISLVLIGHLFPYLFPQPMKTWLGGAGISVGWIAIFALSTIFLWHGLKTTNVSNTHAREIPTQEGNHE